MLSLFSVCHKIYDSDYLIVIIGITFIAHALLYILQEPPYTAIATALVPGFIRSLAI